MSSHSRKRPASSIETDLERAAKIHKGKQKQLKTLATLAETVGFNAASFNKSGYCVLEKFRVRPKVLADVLASAKYLRDKRNKSGKDFVFLRNIDDEHRNRIFGLLATQPLKRFLNNLLKGGFKQPLEDASPYAHHNSAQLARRCVGEIEWSEMHVDQPAAKQRVGATQQNYTMLCGFMLEGATAERDDAGNLLVAPGSHQALAAAFKKVHGDTIAWHGHAKQADHYLGYQPKLKAVRMRSAQVVLMHHQVFHKVAANRSSRDRFCIYFRLTARQRPSGCSKSYPAAMRDPTLETPLLKALVLHQACEGALRINIRRSVHTKVS